MRRVARNVLPPLAVAAAILLLAPRAVHAQAAGTLQATVTVVDVQPSVSAAVALTSLADPGGDVTDDSAIAPPHPLYPFIIEVRAEDGTARPAYTVTFF